MPGLSGRGGYEEGRARRRRPPAEPHTEHGVNIRGPVESGGYRQPYYSGGRIRYSPRPGTYPSYAGGAGVQRIPPPRGYAARGPSGQIVFHTYAGWQAIQRQRQQRAQLQGSLRALAGFGNLAGSIRAALGGPPAVGGDHAGYQRAVRQVGGFLRSLGTAQGARKLGAQVGARYAQGRYLVGGLAQQEAQALAMRPRNIGRPSGLASVPGDLLGNLERAVSDTPGALSDIWKAATHIAPGPLGDPRPSVRDVAGALQTYGRSVEYPTPLHEQLLKRNFGPNRPAQFAQLGADVGNVAAGVLPRGKKGQAQMASFASPLAAGFALNPEGARQTVKDVPNFYAGLPSLIYEPAAGIYEAASGRGTGRLSALWQGIQQNDPIGALVSRGDTGPLTQHPLFALAELRGGFAAGHRLVGSAGRAAGAARPGTMGRTGNVFAAGAEPMSIRYNDMRGRGRPGGGREVFTAEPVRSRAPLVNYAQRRAEIGRLPAQEVLGKFVPHLKHPAEMRRAGVPERTIRARTLVRRGLVRRQDFIQDKGIVRERMGRRESLQAAAGGQPTPSIHLQRFLTDRKTSRALEQTGIGFLLREGMKPGVPLRAQIQAELDRLSHPDISREIQPRSEQESAHFEMRQILENALAPKNRQALELLDRPYKGDRVGRGYRYIETEANYLRGVDRGLVEEQGVMGAQREKAKYVPALVRHLGAREGTAEHAYLTEHGHRQVLLSEAHGHAEASHARARAAVRTAEAATSRLLQQAKEAAGRVDRTRTPREGVVPTRGRASEGVARVKAQAVDDLVQALRAERKHERNARSAADRGDEKVATRHRARAHEARGRAADAQVKLMDVLGRAPEDGRGSRHYGRLIAEAIQREHELHDVAATEERGMGATRRELEAHKTEMRKGKHEAKHMPWMVDARGRRIETLAEAEAALREVGVHTESISHISQVRGLGETSAFRGARADVQGRSEVGGKARSGEATRLGIAPITHEAAIQDVVRKRTRLEAARTNKLVVENSSLAGPTFHLDDPPEGMAKSGKGLAYAKQKQQEILSEAAPRDAEGRIIGDRPQIPGMPEFVVIDRSPFDRKLADLERRNRALGLEDTPESVDRQLLDAHYESMDYEHVTDHPDGHYIIAFKDAVDQQRAHGTASVRTDPGRVWSLLNQQFRKTVLLTSTRWIAGNGIEMGFRLLWAGIGPRGWLTGRRLARIGKEMDEEKWNDIIAGTSGEGAHFGYALERAMTHNANPDLWKSERAKGAVHAFQMWRSGKWSPGRALGFLWNTWATGFGGFNRWMEHQGDLSIIGAQARRDFRDFNNNVVATMHMGRGALEDTVRGLYGTARQERYARRIDQVRGQYSRFSPNMRRLLEVAPFIPWYVNALKFAIAMAPVVGKTPVRTAALIAEFSAMQKKLEEQGHTLNPIGFKGKGFLAVGTVDVPGGHMPFGRFLPFGAFDPSTLQSQFLPQFSGFLSAGAGTDWSGNPLPDPADLGQRVVAGVNSFVESLIPGLSILRRLQEGGGSSAATSTVLTPKVKEGGQIVNAPGFGGDVLGAAEKTFFPFHVIPAQEDKSGGGGGGSTGGSTGGSMGGGGGGGGVTGGSMGGSPAPSASRQLLFSSASSGPPPSPDRQATRIEKGWSGYAFTGRHAPSPDEDPGFDPYWLQQDRPTSARGRQMRRQIGMQAGTPGQQRFADRVVLFRRQAQARQSSQGHSYLPLFELGRALGQSPAGMIAGDLIANRTWARLAPLFQRGQRDMPDVQFRSTGRRDIPAYASTDSHGRRQIVVDPAALTYLLSAARGVRGQARGGLAGMLVHEFAHSQQGRGGGRYVLDRRGMLVDPTKEGGAEAFRRAVAGLVGDPNPPVTSGRRAGGYAAYQRGFGNDLRRALIYQFPRVKRRVGGRR